MKKNSIIYLILFLLLGCGNSNQMDKISIEEQHFVTKAGKPIVFNGLNVVNKNPKDNYITKISDQTIAKLAKDGVNLVRYGISWDACEPEPGVINQKYLQLVAEQVERFNQQGIYVYFDMHQDLYGIKFSNGAPKWATLDHDLPHIRGQVWSDSYFISPAVQQAWDSFWANEKASDGVGLQDHYAKVWEEIARKFKNNNGVIGYDLMNEPFVGKRAKDYFPILFSSIAAIVSERTSQHMSIEDVAAKYKTIDGRFELLQHLNTNQAYEKAIAGLSDLNRAFETSFMQPFYQKTADHIRSVDTSKILFLNHGYFCNSGIKTALGLLKLNDESIDPLVAYSAHAYDIMVDTDKMSAASLDRISFLFDQIHKSAQRLKVPVLIGEWGALYGNDENMVAIARRHKEIFKKYNWSHTYWVYDERFIKTKQYKVVIYSSLSASTGFDLETLRL